MRPKVCNGPKMKHAVGAIFKDDGIKNPAYRKSPTGLQPEPDSGAGAKVGVQTAVRSTAAALGQLPGAIRMRGEKVAAVSLSCFSVLLRF